MSFGVNTPRVPWKFSELYLLLLSCRTQNVTIIIFLLFAPFDRSWICVEIYVNAINLLLWYNILCRNWHYWQIITGMLLICAHSGLPHRISHCLFFFAPWFLAHSMDIWCVTSCLLAFFKLWLADLLLFLSVSAFIYQQEFFCLFVSHILSIISLPW